MKTLHLNQLSLVQFKNLGEVNLTLSDKVNCFVGDNGAGKTNILDAIYYLSFCKSYFNPVDSQNIQHDSAFFMVQGEYEKDKKNEQIYCGIKKGQKKLFKRNKKEYDRLSDHIGLIPLVMITPYDVELIYEGSETRRKFLDGIISQYNKHYLEHILQLAKIIAQRNATLKSMAKSGYFDATLLEIYNDQLIVLAPKIHAERKAFLEEFIPLFNEYYSTLSNDAESVSLSYDSELNENSMADLLIQSTDKDRYKQYTTSGPHKDDLTFLIGERPLKKFGSQGQQKSFLIALKLAQYQFIATKTNTKPLLLLDDIFDKIDEIRAQNLMDLVSVPSFGQLFITDTHPTRVQSLFEDKQIAISVFEVKQGVV
jgi:DNA replication and repair protein RecF